MEFFPDVFKLLEALISKVYTRANALSVKIVLEDVVDYLISLLHF